MKITWFLRAACAVAIAATGISAAAQEKTGNKPGFTLALAPPASS
ncbi:hypothetical protein ACFSTI_28790 [Rhizorhabdus histidinilytica]